MSSKHSALELSIQYTFKKPDLLKQALTHRSFSKNHNETLEFMGDAILGAIIAEALYYKFPEATEGELSRLRASLVCGEMLATIAPELSLSEQIYVGGGEQASGGRYRQSILADVMEALFGAVFLDSDYPTVRRTILSLYDSRLALLSLDDSKDPKTRLQEYLQSKNEALPVYTIVRTEGEQHAQTFYIDCTAINIKCMGSGSNRRKAEQAAALNVLKQLQENSYD